MYVLDLIDLPVNNRDLSKGKKLITKRVDRDHCVVRHAFSRMKHGRYSVKYTVTRIRNSLRSKFGFNDPIGCLVALVGARPQESALVCDSAIGDREPSKKRKKIIKWVQRSGLSTYLLILVSTDRINKRSLCFNDQTAADQPLSLITSIPTHCT